MPRETEIKVGTRGPERKSARGARGRVRTEPSEWLLVRGEGKRSPGRRDRSKVKRQKTGGQRIGKDTQFQRKRQAPGGVRCKWRGGGIMDQAGWDNSIHRTES